MRCLFGTLGVPSYAGIILRLTAIFFFDNKSKTELTTIAFLLENLIDLLLRSAHLYQDGGQVLAVLRAALTAVENCRQSEDDPTTR